MIDAPLLGSARVSRAVSGVLAGHILFPHLPSGRFAAGNLPAALVPQGLLTPSLTGGLNPKSNTLRPLLTLFKLKMKSTRSDLTRFNPRHNALASWTAAAMTPLFPWSGMSPRPMCSLVRPHPLSKSVSIRAHLSRAMPDPWLKSFHVTPCPPTSLEANKAKSLQKNSDFFPATFAGNHWKIPLKPPKKPVKFGQKTRDF
jgi:hypothetical protein